MKIICESQEEYDKLMEASRYLHDFRVWVETFGEGKTYVEFVNEEREIELPLSGMLIDLDRNIEMVDTLSHLHVSKNLVSIQPTLSKEQVKEIMESPVKLGLGNTKTKNKEI